MNAHRDVIVIGGSGDSLRSLSRVVTNLPLTFPATVLVALDTAINGAGELRDALAEQVGLPVSYGVQGEELKPGHVYLAPPDRHMVVLPTKQPQNGDYQANT